MLKLYVLFLRNALLCTVLMFAAVISAQAGYLYALNDNRMGNNIYGYSVNEATGALDPLAGFPVATGGSGSDGTNSELLTIDRMTNRLYIINRGSSTVSAYSISMTTGTLTALPFSPIVLPSGFYNTIATHPSGSPLIIGDGGGSRSFSYIITRTTATAATDSPFSTGAASPFSSAFSRNGNFFYTGGNSANGYIAGFGVNAANGVITPLAGSPFNTITKNPEGYATDSQDRLFVVNFNDFSPNRLQAFTTVSGIPSAVTGNPFPGLRGAIDGVLSPNENFYVVAARNGNQVGSFQIAGTGSETTLDIVIGSPVASGGLLTDALVFNSAGTFVFAANGNSRNITTYGFNQTTGVLTFNNVQAENALGIAGILTGIDYLPTAPTAATVIVGGRVTTASGGGVANVSISLTNSTGNVRTATTGASGFYNFADVPAGVTYIITVRGKRYTFAQSSQVVNVNDDVMEVNFVGTSEKRLRAF